MRTINICDVCKVLEEIVMQVNAISLLTLLLLRHGLDWLSRHGCVIDTFFHFRPCLTGLSGCCIFTVSMHKSANTVSELRLKQEAKYLPVLLPPALSSIVASATGKKLACTSWSCCEKALLCLAAAAATLNLVALSTATRLSFA